MTCDHGAPHSKGIAGGVRGGGGRGAGGGERVREGWWGGLGLGGGEVRD